MNRPTFSMNAQEFEAFIEQGIYRFCSLLEDVTPVEAAVENVARQIVNEALWYRDRLSR